MPSAAEVVAAWRRLPLVGFNQITGRAPFVVVAPHPDDESFGCGGLIAEACARGSEVHVAILTDGTRSHPNSREYDRLRRKGLREAEARSAAAALGVPERRLHFFGLADGAAPREGREFDSAVERLAALITAGVAETVFATWQYDPHEDHVAGHFIAAAATRRTGARLVAYPIWSWSLAPHQALPDSALVGVRLDISHRLEAKRRAITAHASQLGGVITDDPWGKPLPESLLANFRQPFEVFLHSE